MDLHEATNKVVIVIGGDGGLGSCGFPRIMEERGEYDGDSLEKVLPAAFSAVCIVRKDVITIDIDIKFVTFFPCLLDHPCIDIVLAHVVYQIFEFGEVGGMIDKYYSVSISWATPETLGVLRVDGGEVLFLMFVTVVVAYKFMGL